MPENRKLRVFFCHASQDKSIVRELYQRFLVEAIFLLGQDWDIEIENVAEKENIWGL